jgi:hypothetical protein
LFIEVSTKSAARIASVCGSSVRNAQLKQFASTHLIYCAAGTNINNGTAQSEDTSLVGSPLQRLDVPLT